MDRRTTDEDRSRKLICHYVTGELRKSNILMDKQIVGGTVFHKHNFLFTKGTLKSFPERYHLECYYPASQE